MLQRGHCGRWLWPFSQLPIRWRALGQFWDSALVTLRDIKMAQELSGLQEKTAVLHAGLQALIARENARRLAALGGTERRLKPIPRRRTRTAR